MKTFTEDERLELQEKIEAATGCSFKEPQPEAFISAAAGTLALIYAQTVDPAPYHECVQMAITVSLPGNYYFTLAKFRCN